MIIIIFQKKPVRISNYTSTLKTHAHAQTPFRNSCLNRKAKKELSLIEGKRKTIEFCLFVVDKTSPM